MMSSTGIGVLSHLNITRTRVEDGGLYSCIALEGDQSASHAARLDIYGMAFLETERW